MKRFLPLLIAALILATALAVVAQQRPNRKEKAPGARFAQPTADAQPDWWGPPPKDDREEGPKARGIVQAVSDNTITLKTISGFNTYSVTSSTEILIKRKPGVLSDIAVGDIAGINFEYMSDLTTQAKKINAAKPEAAGKITAIAGSVVTITSEGGVAWEVVTSSDTRVGFNRMPMTFADLRVGYWARAEGLTEGNRVQARMIQLRLPVFRGAVTEISNNAIQIKTIDQRIMNGALSTRTVVVIKPRVGPNTRGTIADIKKGMAVNIAGHLTEGQPIEVLLVELMIGQ
ncbi:MAG: DUF5666 domain-containing protein [Armatimonadota bacterium]|nr:DUF5666 domain-containing protein [Armatimonadota bacterium]